MNKVVTWLFGLTSEGNRLRQFEQSRKQLAHDLAKFHPSTARLVDLEGLFDQIEAAGLVYDGALESGVAGLYPVDGSWPQHSTIQVNLLNWPREGAISFWPPLSTSRPATALPSYVPKEKQAMISFSPTEFSQALQQACEMTQEAFEHNCANAVPEE